MIDTHQKTHWSEGQGLKDGILEHNSSSKIYPIHSLHNSLGK